MTPKRPESVLVVVHTADEALVLRRVGPPVFWQSVTGALEWGEAPAAAARRELEEETGIETAEMRETGVTQTFDIMPSARQYYAPGVSRNLEHLFYAPLPERAAIRLSPEEHDAYQWLPFGDAADCVWSWSNAAAIRSLLTP